MKESFTLVFIATVLLFSQQVEAQQVEVPADAAAAAAAVCRTGEAAKSLLECRATFLQFAGENFTDDCEEGIIQEFMTCITAIEECRNVSAFVEKSLYDYYGCMDTSIAVRQKRSHCRVVCYVSCGYVCDPFICLYACRRICGRVCRTGRSVPEIAPEDSDDQTGNTCSNCVCTIDVANPPPEVTRVQDTLLPSSAPVVFGNISLFLFLCFLTAAMT